ncbi:MAG TPA: PDZ domain-containing protein, partial [Thermoanaerobaculia bacterium]|nr:PDZ domain-containing protein [Thermoanaerobaculia bacterium]
MQVRRIVVLLAAATAVIACRSARVVKPITLCQHGMLGIEPGRGATVAEVLPGSPAEAAGIKRNDIVVKVGSKAITNECELIDNAFDLPTCSPIAVTLSRGGKTVDAVVKPVDQ